MCAKERWSKRTGYWRRSTRHLLSLTSDQLQVQIDSLNAQITREEAELAGENPDFPPNQIRTSEKYQKFQKQLFDQRAAQYSAQVESFDQKIAQTRGDHREISK